MFFTSESTIEDWQYTVPVDFNNGQKLKDLECSYTQPNLTINPGTKGECIIIVGGKSFSYEGVTFSELETAADTFMTVRKVEPFIIPGHNVR